MTSIAPNEIEDDPQKYYDINQQFLDKLRSLRKINIDNNGNVDTRADETTIRKIITASDPLPHALIPGAQVTIPPGIRIACISTFAMMTHLALRSSLLSINPQSYGDTIPLIEVPISTFNSRPLRSAITSEINRRQSTLTIDGVKELIKQELKRQGIHNTPRFTFTTISSNKELLEKTFIDVTSGWKTLLTSEFRDIVISTIIVFGLSIMKHTRSLASISKDIIQNIMSVVYNPLSIIGRKRKRTITSEDTIWSIIQNIQLTVVKILTTIPDTILSGIVSRMTPGELNKFVSEDTSILEQFRMFITKLFTVIKDYVTGNRFSNEALKEFVKMDWIFKYRDPLTIPRKDAPECNQEN